MSAASSPTTALLPARVARSRHRIRRQQIRWTNLYIRDTIKQARLGAEDRPDTADANPGVSFQYQDTAWYARQLIDTQFVGEFKPMDGIDVDIRAGYANSQRRRRSS